MPRRFRVNLEKFADTDELEDEKSFVRTQFPNMRFSYWKYGEVLKIDHHRVMATSFAAVPGTYVLFNAPKLEIDPPINRRDVLKETYRKVGGKLSTLNLLVGYKVMNPETRQPFINASEVLKAQGEQVFNRWITLYPDTPAWAQMEYSNHFLNTFKRVLAEDSSTSSSSIGMVEFCWSPYPSDQDVAYLTNYDQFYLSIKVYVTH